MLVWSPMSDNRFILLLIWGLSFEYDCAFARLGFWLKGRQYICFVEEKYASKYLHQFWKYTDIYFSWYLLKICILFAHDLISGLTSCRTRISGFSSFTYLVCSTCNKWAQQAFLAASNSTYMSLYPFWSSLLVSTWLLFFSFDF